MEQLHLEGILSTLIYSAIGILVFLVALGLIEMATKYSINRKIAHEGNVALAIILGSIILALGMIISAAIH